MNITTQKALRGKRFQHYVWYKNNLYYTDNLSLRKSTEDDFAASQGKDRNKNVLDKAAVISLIPKTSAHGFLAGTYIRQAGLRK